MLQTHSMQLEVNSKIGDGLIDICKMATGEFILRFRLRKLAERSKDENADGEFGGFVTTDPNKSNPPIKSFSDVVPTIKTQCDDFFGKGNWTIEDFAINEIDVELCNESTSTSLIEQHKLEVSSKRLIE
jgi:hypothetical protein